MITYIYSILIFFYRSSKDYLSFGTHFTLSLSLPQSLCLLIFILSISKGLSHFGSMHPYRSIIIRTLFSSMINSVYLCLLPKAFSIDLSSASTLFHSSLGSLIFVYGRSCIGAISSDSIGPHARVPVRQAANQTKISIAYFHFAVQ